MPTAKPKLVIIEGKDKGKVIPLRDGTAVIGRSKGDVLVQDARISRSHVAIHFDEKKGKLSFTDLKSLNGTLVNGQQVESGDLLDGDKLRLGNTLFDCQISGSAEEASASEPAAASPKAPASKTTEESGISEAPQALEIEERPEPSLSALGDLAEIDHEALSAPPPPRRRPEKSEDSKKNGSDEIRTRLAGMAAFRRLPRLPMGRMSKTTRTAVLGGVLVVGLWVLFGGKGNDTLDRDLGSVELLQSSGKLDEALAKAEAIREQHPNNSEVYMHLASLYVEMRKTDAAVSAYLKARELEPAQPLVSVRLISLYLRNGMLAEADEEMKNLDQELKEGKHSKQLFVEAAQLFLEFKDLKHAPEKTLILSRALQTELAPQSTIGYKLEAQVLFQTGHNEEAIKTVEKGLEIDPKDEWLLENLAFGKLSLKDLSGAAEVVENWIRLQPGAVKALLVMAYLKYNDKNYAGALPYIQKIIELAAGGHPDALYPEALNLAGQIYWQQGQAQPAVGMLKQACELGFRQSCDHEALRVPSAAPGENTAAPETKSEPPSPPAHPAAPTSRPAPAAPARRGGSKAPARRR